MKSFIKAHKRNESGQSVSTTSSKTPVSSPKPSLNKSPSPVNSNSPKKLLIPIKNLFNKRSRTADSLSFVINHVPTECSPSSNNLLASSSRKSKTSSIIVRRKDSRLKVTAYHHGYNSDSDSSASSNESNFSFVRDMKGGRNTSIKYYKTKKPEQAISEKVYFDSNMEIDDIEDYDFENNGLGGDEDLDDLAYAEAEEEVPSAMDFEDAHTYPSITKQTTVSIYEEEPIPSALNFEDDFEAMSLNDKTVPLLNTHAVSDFDDDDSDIDRENSFSRKIPETIVFRPNPGPTLDSPFLETHDIGSSQESFIPDSSNYTQQNGLGIAHDRSNGDLSSSFDMGDYRGSNSVDLRDHISFTRKPFFKSYHLSVEEISLTEDSSVGVTDSFGNFLGIDSSHFIPSASPNVEMFDNLNLFDLNSPIINGLTIGNSMTARFRNLNATNIKSFHGSFDEIELSSRINRAEVKQVALDQPLDQPPDRAQTLLISEAGFSSHEIEADHKAVSTSLLGMLQEKQMDVPKCLSKSKNTEESPTIERNSVNDMMSLLENLQLKTSSSDKRKSVENMMNFLKTIQNEDKECFKAKPILPVIQEQTEVQKRIHHEWVHNEDSESFFLNKQSYNELNEHELDLLDEINQLPEDFDFDQVDRLDKFDTLNSFMRSNSFNKKPKRVLPSAHSSSCNQIKTQNKTVTYYGPSHAVSQNQNPTNTQLSPITEKHTPKIPSSNAFNLVTINEDKFNFQ